MCLDLHSSNGVSGVQSLSDGSVSLRWIMKHISMLTTQLYRIKPSTAK